MMIYEHTSYRSYLKSVLAERVGKNPSYSLRAMAKSLNIYPSYLSEVARGSKNLSLSTAVKVAKNLNLKNKETEYFCLLVQYESTKSNDLKESISQKIKSLNRKSEIHDLSVDSFKLIADWYHYPIFEMTSLTNFEFTPKNIAKRLGITSLEADVAIERLCRLGLIKRLPDGKYVRVQGPALVRSDEKNESLRRFHRQMLELAIQSLETQTTKERFTGTETLPIDTQQLPEAYELIEEFFSKIIDLASKGTSKNEVYHLGVQFFNLTKGAK